MRERDAQNMQVSVTILTHHEMTPLILNEVRLLRVHIGPAVEQKSHHNDHIQIPTSCCQKQRCPTPLGLRRVQVYGLLEE